MLKISFLSEKYYQVWHENFPYPLKGKQYKKKKIVIKEA